MAFLVPILAGLGGAAAATALGAGTALSVGAGIATGAAAASLMNQGGGGAPAPAAPVAPPPAPPPAPTPPPAPPTTTFGGYDWMSDFDFSPGGAVRNVEAIRGERQGDTRVRGTGAGRQSTILTSAQGVRGEEGTRPRRTLGGSAQPVGMMQGGLLGGRSAGAGLLA